MVCVKNMLLKMIGCFDASDEHDKELRGDLAKIGKKMEACAV